MGAIIEKVFKTKGGDIHYFVNNITDSKYTLVFLPGLTADHRLFEKQIEYFKDKYNLLVWDAPGHNLSRPFTLDFELKDKAKWLHSIILQENIQNPILIGQSMGGYVSQFYIELYPNEVSGFISIDSAPLKRKYMTSAEIWMLKHCEGMYLMFPWKPLISAGSKECAESEYGREIMKQMMLTYTKREYCALAGHGYLILAGAVETNLPFDITCPALLICGEKDMAGSTKQYNKKWAVGENLPIFWVPNAGHNSNTDCPELINQKIVDFISNIDSLNSQ